MSFVLTSNGYVTVNVPGGSSIAVYTQGQAQVLQVQVAPNFPATTTSLGYVNNAQTVFGPFTTATQVAIDNKTDLRVFYEIGTAPRVQQERLITLFGLSPGALNATGTLTAELCLSGIVTSTTAAAVAATLDTGAIFDAKSTFNVGDTFVWSAINTGATNAFTVTASTGHTLVGSGVVALSSSGLFATTKTAANTFVTYRIAS
jgi:hypothetical protein